MKCSALNVDFNGVRLDPLGSRSPPYERIKFGYLLENVRFLLLWTNLARQWLQIDTDLLLIITTTDGELSGRTNIDDLERPWTPKIGVFSEFLAILGCHAHLEWIFAEIKLMLSRISWALAQISCYYYYYLRRFMDALVSMMMTALTGCTDELVYHGRRRAS